MFREIPFRNHSQIPVRGPGAKKGALKVLEPFKGGLEKNYNKFSSKN